MEKERKVLAIIPSYNVERTIGNVLDGIKDIVDGVIVVNDGSYDRTRQIAEDKKVRILDHSKNMGLGFALRTGFKEAIDSDFDAVITIDGDGQHGIEDIANIVKIYKEKGIPVIIGSRLKNKEEWKNFPKARLLGNLIMTFLTNLACGRKVTTDSQSGLRLIEREVLKKMELKSKRMEISSEIILEIHRNKFPIFEVPIKAIYKEEKSNYRVILDSLRILFLIISRIFQKA
jgi:glycosyltransferase involved in cell wall biosynthesis